MLPQNNLLSGKTIQGSICVLIFFRYVGVCCGIKVLSVLTFLLDWWLIKRRETSEKKQTALTVGEVVNSIISLDKRKFSIFLRTIDVLSYFCHRHWRWQSQILNRESLSNLPMIKVHAIAEGYFFFHWQVDHRFAVQNLTLPPSM